MQRSPSPQWRECNYLRYQIQPASRLFRGLGQGLQALSYTFSNPLLIDAVRISQFSNIARAVNKCAKFLSNRKRGFLKRRILRTSCINFKCWQNQLSHFLDIYPSNPDEGFYNESNVKAGWSRERKDIHAIISNITPYWTKILFQQRSNVIGFFCVFFGLLLENQLSGEVAKSPSYTSTPFAFVVSPKLNQGKKVIKKGVSKARAN